jgi:hypothetical protein
MNKKTEDEPSKASAVELEEKDLDTVQGGADLDHVGNYNFKVEIAGVKPRLTTEEAGLRAGLRATNKLGIRATPGTKLRK